MIINFKNIPYDLEEMLDSGEHCCGSYSDSFDKLMLENKFFEYGGTRRSHRVISDEAKELGYWGVVKVLTGKTKNEILTEIEQEIKEKDIKKIFETAKKYNYIITNGK